MIKHVFQKVFWKKSSFKKVGKNQKVKKSVRWIWVWIGVLRAVLFWVDKGWRMESVAVRMSMHSNHSQDHVCVSDRVQNCEFCTCLPRFSRVAHTQAWLKPWKEDSQLSTSKCCSERIGEMSFRTWGANKTSAGEPSKIDSQNSPHNFWLKTIALIDHQNEFKHDFINRNKLQIGVSTENGNDKRSWTNCLSTSFLTEFNETSNYSLDRVLKPSSFQSQHALAWLKSHSQSSNAIQLRCSIDMFRWKVCKHFLGGLLSKRDLAFRDHRLYPEKHGVDVLPRLLPIAVPAVASIHTWA